MLRIAMSGRYVQNLGSPDNRDLTNAYAKQLSHKVPILYCVNMFDILILMVNFRGVAPHALVFLPALTIISLCILRLVYWLPANTGKRSQERLIRDIGRVPIYGTIVSFAPMVWALALYGYGDQADQSLVHYMTAISCFAAIFTLSQSPRGALLISISVMGPSTIFFALHPHPNTSAIVAIQIIVTILVSAITIYSHAAFVRLEFSRSEILRQKQMIEDLAEVNLVSANRDSLTGAHNRRKILDLLAENIAQNPQAGPWLAILDLDGFKHVNDSFGHAAGDLILQVVSERIGAVPVVEAFGRIGGDEFAIVIPGTLTEGEVTASLDCFIGQLRQPIDVRGFQLAIRGSIGLHRCLGSDVGECLERADAALYRAKAARNNNVVRFNASDEREFIEHRAMTRVFTSANLTDQIALVYQPIIDIDTGKTVSFEALARWSPDGSNWLPPSAFIQLAEDTGRIGELTEDVLVKAIRECRAWESAQRLSINLSARDILRDDVAERIGGIVAAAGAPPNAIIFEITETALLSDYRRAANNLEQLRSLGFRIALDDFGTGQSSLSHVLNLPLDHIKIDQSFARDLVHSEGAKAIVRTILTLAHQLKVDCTIEGIETVEQQLVARSLGVRFMQGYLFGRPDQAAALFGAAELTLLARAS